MSSRPPIKVGISSCLLGQRVGADAESAVAVFDSLKQLFLFLGRSRCGEQSRRNSQTVGELFQIAIMLLGEHLGRRQPERLIAIVHDAQRREPRDHGLSRADIALHQPPHGFPASQVSFDFVQNPPLRAGQPKWQQLGHPLTQRLDRFARAPGLPGRIEPQGPDDVRRLIDAHNAMEGRITALLDEKDVMLGAIGHDLKTPLAALRVRIEGFLTPAELKKRKGDTFLADDRATAISTFFENEGVSQDRLKFINSTPFDQESVDMEKFRASKLAETPHAVFEVIETPFLFDVKFTDPQNGMIAGLGGVVLRSSDGGRTWRYTETDTKLALFSIALGKNATIAIGERGQRRATTDGGDTWERLGDEGFGSFPSNIYGYLRDAECGTRESCWMVGEGGFVAHSTDGGQSWEQVLPPQARDGEAVAAQAEE